MLSCRMDPNEGYAQAYGELFARVYNRYWSSYAERMAPALVELFARLQPGGAGARVLDVCCGTGQLARELVAAGYEVVGIDLSAHMLEHAKANNAAAVADGRAEFLLEDAAAFSIDRPASIAVSIFDALNHLPDERALAGCFASVHESLEPGGHFVFDLNTPLGLARWNGINVEENEEVTIINRGIYAPGAERAFTSITGFLRRADGAWDRFREIAYETVFPHDLVVDLLVAAGFVEVATFAAQDLTTPVDDVVGLPRVFYTCTRNTP